MAIFDDLPFPFHKPQGQELLRVMVALYRTEREIIALVEQHGIDPADLPGGLTPRQLWHEVLQMANAKGVTRDIAKTALAQFPRNPNAAFLQALLANKPTRVSAEPTDASGASRFISGTDKVGEPEALLFYDDLTMPTGRLSVLIESLQHVMTLVPSVCLLRIGSPLGEFFGTGFKISKDLVLTNEHVLLPSGNKATSVYADFMFDIDPAGAALDVVTLTGDIATITGDKADDWAIVKVGGMDAAWPIVDLAHAPVPKAGDLTFILQHPGGQRKRIGYVRNMISDVTDRVVHYLTDTQPGSSGSPVFDAGGRCIALHHVGGEPQEVIGKPPVSKNEGIRISRVHAALVAKGLI
jgi:hypothetical protein